MKYPILQNAVLLISIFFSTFVLNTKLLNAQGDELIAFGTTQVVNPHVPPCDLVIDLYAKLLDSQDVTRETDLTELNTFIDNSIGKVLTGLELAPWKSVKSNLDGSIYHSAGIKFGEFEGVNLTVYKEMSEGSRVFRSAYLDFPSDANASIQIFDDIFKTNFSTLIPNEIKSAIPTVKNLAIEFTDQKKVTAFSATLGIGAAGFNIVEGFQINEQQLTVGATAIETGSPVKVVGVAGKYNLGKNGEIPLLVVGTLGYNGKGKDETVPKSEITLAAEINNISVQNIINAIGVGDNNLVNLATDKLPKELLDFQINSVFGKIVPSKGVGWFSTATDLFAMELGFGNNKGGTRQYTFGIQLPNVDDIGKFVDLPPEVNHFRNIDLAAYISSSEADLMSSLPAFNSNAAFRFVRGLNFIGIWTPDAEKQAELGVKNLNVLAQIPLKEGELAPQGLRLSGNLVSDIDIGENFLTLNGTGVILNVDPQDLWFGIKGDISIWVAHDTELNLRGTTKVKPIEAEAVGEVLLTAVNGNGAGTVNSNGDWVHPFGIPGVTFKKLGIAIGGGGTFPWLNQVGFAGKMGIGLNQQRQIIGELAAQIDANTYDDLYFEAAVNQLSITDVLEAFTDNSFTIKNSEFPEPIKNAFNTGMENAHAIVATSNQLVFGKNVSRQLLVKGDFTLWDKKASVDFELKPNALTLKGNGYIDPIVLQPNGFPFVLFGLEGIGGPDPLNARPNISFSASMSEIPYFKMSGKVTMLGVTGQSEIIFDKSQMLIDLRGNIADIGPKVNLTAHLDKYTDLPNASFFVEGKFENLNQQELKNGIISFIDQESKKAQGSFATIQKEIDKAKNGSPLPKEILNISNELLTGLSNAEKGAAYIGKEITKGILNNIEIKRLGFNCHLDKVDGSVAAFAQAKIGPDLHIDANFDLPINWLSAATDIEKLAQFIGKSILEEIGANEKLFKEVEGFLNSIPGTFQNVVTDIAPGIMWYDPPTQDQLIAQKSLLFENWAGYVVNYNIDYTTKGKRKNKNFDLAGWFRTPIRFPDDASNIKVTGSISYGIFGKAEVENINIPQLGPHTIKAYGTLFNPSIEHHPPQANRFVVNLAEEETNGIMTLWQQPNYQGKIANLTSLDFGNKTYSVDPQKELINSIKVHRGVQIAQYVNGDFDKLVSSISNIPNNVDSLVFYRTLHYWGWNDKELYVLLMPDGNFLVSSDKNFPKNNRQIKEKIQYMYGPNIISINEKREMKIEDGQFCIAKNADWSNPSNVIKTNTWGHYVPGTITTGLITRGRDFKLPAEYFETMIEQDYVFNCFDFQQNPQYVKPIENQFIISPHDYFEPVTTTNSLDYIAHDGTEWTAKIVNGKFEHTSKEDGFKYTSISIPYKGIYGNHYEYTLEKRKTVPYAGLLDFAESVNSDEIETTKDNLAFDKTSKQSSVQDNWNLSTKATNGLLAIENRREKVGLSTNSPYVYDFANNTVTGGDKMIQEASTNIEYIEDLSKTKVENNAYWEVDLGAFYDIRVINIYAPKDCCKEAQRDMIIAVSDKPFKANNEGGMFAKNFNSFNGLRSFTGNMFGRYIRIYKDTDAANQIALSEVEVYGKLSDYNPLIEELTSTTWSKDEWGNGYHSGSFADIGGGKVRWTNDNGYQWEGEPSADKTISFKALQHSDLPFSFKTQGSEIISFTINGEVYKKYDYIIHALLIKEFERRPYENKYHKGKFTKLPNGNIKWTNDAGVNWETKLDTNRKLLDTTVGDCYYKNQKNGDAMKLLFDDKNKLTGFSFLNETYHTR